MDLAFLCDEIEFYVFNCLLCCGDDKTSYLSFCILYLKSPLIEELLSLELMLSCIGERGVEEMFEEKLNEA